jgi:hypothetical protein
MIHFNPEIYLCPLTGISLQELFFGSPSTTDKAAFC